MSQLVAFLLEKFRCEIGDYSRNTRKGAGVFLLLFIQQIIYHLPIK